MRNEAGRKVEAEGGQVMVSCGCLEKLRRLKKFVLERRVKLLFKSSLFRRFWVLN